MPPHVSFLKSSTSWFKNDRFLHKYPFYQCTESNVGNCGLRTLNVPLNGVLVMVNLQRSGEKAPTESKTPTSSSSHTRASTTRSVKLRSLRSTPTSWSPMRRKALSIYTWVSFLLENNFLRSSTRVRTQQSREEDHLYQLLRPPQD